MVLDDGNVKVADFGIARIDTSEFTIVGDLLGTPAYMSPEQLSGASVDKRTDLFAAGVIFFEMLTSVKPFRGKSLTEIISFMERRGPEDIRALNPQVPDALKRVITKALAFDPAARYGDAAEFSRAVASAIQLPSPSPTRAMSAARAPEPTAGAPPVAQPEPTSSGLTTLHPGLVREIERDLATFIGPVASIVVKRALREVTDLPALYDLLATRVENPQDRTALLATGRQRTAATLGSSRPADPPTLPPGPEQRPDNASARPDPAHLSAIELRLIRYIGPIAKILIKRELDKFETMDKFYLALAAHIPDERDRRAFLEAQGAD